MKMGLGHDVIYIDRVQRAVDRYGERFLNKVFTAAELDLSRGKVQSLAGRFAAKEATAKALGTGIGPISWVDIQILTDNKKAPVITLDGEAKNLSEKKGFTHWSVSISHERDIASAVVIGFGQIS